MTNDISKQSKPVQTLELLQYTGSMSFPGHVYDSSKRAGKVRWNFTDNITDADTKQHMYSKAKPVNDHESFCHLYRN